jgi:hypothetical protein
MIVQTTDRNGKKYYFDHSNICAINFGVETDANTIITLSNHEVAYSNLELTDAIGQLKYGLENNIGAIELG